MRSGRKCILFVSPVPPPVHGASLAMQYALDELGGGEFEVLHINARFAEGLNDLQNFSLRKLWRLTAFCWRMLRHVLRGGVDRVVLTPTFYFKPFLKDAVLIWWSTLILRRRTAAWIHMDYRMMGYERLSRPARWLVRTTFRRCDRFILCTARLKDFMPAWLPAERMDAMENGTPAPVPLRQRAAAAPVRVVYLSNLEPAKGWAVLLEVARRICHDVPGVEFVFHGRPAFALFEEEIRREFAAADDGRGRIRYEGPVFDADKWQALADADVFAFPSFHEAFPLSILEAMAAGLPIVATDVGGVADAVGHGNGGLIVPPRDVAALEARLREMVADAGMRERMGTANRRRYDERFTVGAYGRRWREWLKTRA